jgi:AraC-like DNA-binding protein
MDTEYTRPLKLAELADAAHLSRFYFLRSFRRVYHVTPHECLTRRRVEHAKALLAADELTITEICLEVGFESLSSFSTLFHRLVGWSPSIYRARAWEMKRNPRKFIPACYIQQFGLDRLLPPAAP